MKPKRTQRHPGHNWKGKDVRADDKATLSQSKPTSVVSSRAQLKPFAGKVFFLDLPSNRVAETLENDVKELGGTVEKFFSKEIQYLVSNKREARYVQYLRQDSPVPSPGSGQSPPHPHSKMKQPGSLGNNSKTRSQGQADTFVKSRGKSLVERVVREQERVQMNKILSNALEWGVKILYIDDIMAYVQKKKKVLNSQCPATTADKTCVKAESGPKQGFQKCKGGRLGKPFIKVEDSSRHYRPIYLTMSNLPEFNLKTFPPCSPFFVEEKSPPGNTQRGQRGVKASASEERGQCRKKNRDKKRGGYCECCMLKYENVTTHLQSQRHKAFSKSDKYMVVDKLVSTLQSNFTHIRNQVKRPKCSVSSVLIAPGPCGKTELRLKGYLDATEIIKEEHRPTVDGHEGCYSGHALKIGSVPVSAALSHRRSSDRSKHKSLARKRPGKGKSLTSCTQVASHPRMETAPSRGQCFASIPSRATELHENPTSHCHDRNERTEVSSKPLNAVTKEHEPAEKKQDYSASEDVQDGNVLQRQISGSSLSVKEETNCTLNHSPVHKIQRRVRLYKRKRRKMDTCVEHEKPRDIPDGSVRTLCELFQSSDDMEVEFVGFENNEEEMN